MAFEELSRKFQNIFSSLRSHGTLTENDVKLAMKEVKMALLSADVSYKVVKKFLASVEEKAVGETILQSLNPGQMVIKVVHDELVTLLGEKEEILTFPPQSDPSVILLCGLQGAGKTTMAAKLAAKILSQGKHPLLVPLDVYRPAAKEQLRINAEKVKVPLYEEEGSDVLKLAKNSITYARENHRNVVIFDTAGRLHIDESMMAELQTIKENISVDHTILVVDAMTGQDAVNVAADFNEKISISGVILTKLDGDTRGGAALSIRETVGKPIYFAGVGEKMTDLEIFYPERMANRILGMGDVLTLIEKASQETNLEEAEELAEKLKKGKFDYNDFVSQIKSMRSMGGIGSLLTMLPGMGAKKNLLQGIDVEESEKKLKKIEVMVQSMTPYERTHPDKMDLSRKVRIAKGAGVPIDDVHRMVKQFDETKKMMKQFTNKGGKGGKFKLPF